VDRSTQAAFGPHAYWSTPVVWLGIAGLGISLASLVVVFARRRKSPNRYIAAIALCLVGCMIAFGSMLLPMVDVVTKTSSGVGEDEGR